MQSGFGVKDLLFALNDSVVNFASDSAEVPESMAPFLKTAAADLKQLKAGHVLEIAGYTDNTGDAALNLALSQKRAEAVREALIKYGADPDMLVAKGYGEADPDRQQRHRRGPAEEPPHRVSCREGADVEQGLTERQALHAPTTVSPPEPYSPSAWRWSSGRRRRARA